jgi:hypothetical protein
MEGITMSSNPASFSFSERVKKAAKAAKVDEDKLLAELAEIGVEPNDEDALEVVRVYGGLGSVFSKAGAKEARGAHGVNVLVGLDPAEQAEADKPAASTKSDVAQLIEANRPVEQWSDKELVEAYGIDGDTRVTDTLAKKAKGNPFVVFDEDGNVDVETTIELLRLSRRQATPDTYNNKKGELKNVYRVGEFPMTYLEECPIFDDIILVNGFCERSKVSWKDVSIEDRVIVRVAHEVVGLDEDHFSVQKLVDRIKSEGSARSLLAGPVKLAYEDLEESGRLPRLRRKYSSTNASSDPFYVRKSGHISH